MEDLTAQTYTDNAIKIAISLQTPKYGDTPTDNDQLVPKRYVAGQIASVYASVFSGLGTTVLNSTIFRDGSDGTIVFNGTNVIAGASVTAASVYTFTRDIYSLNTSIKSGVTIKENGWRLFCSNAYDTLGQINGDGGDGTNGGNAGNGTNGGGGTGGAGGSTGTGGTAAQAAGYFLATLPGTIGNNGTNGSSSGGQGATGSNGNVATNIAAHSLSSVVGRVSGSGGAGGHTNSFPIDPVGGASVAGGSTVYRLVPPEKDAFNYDTFLDINASGTTAKYDASPSDGGSGGGAGGNADATAGGGGGGGSGGTGAPGGIVYVAARYMTIGSVASHSAKGGNGGNGGNGGTGSSNNAGGGGGGGGGSGGNGGYIFFVYASIIGLGQNQNYVTGGTGGNGGTLGIGGGNATQGVNGVAGIIGNDGTVYKIQIK